MTDGRRRIQMPQVILDDGGVEYKLPMRSKVQVVDLLLTQPYHHCMDREIFVLKRSSVTTEPSQGEDNVPA